MNFQQHLLTQRRGDTENENLALPTLTGNSVVMLSKAKHPSGETLTINATGIPHCVRNDKFPVKAGRAENLCVSAPLR